MIEDSKLTKEEQRIVGELTDKLVEAGDKEDINRAELFSRLSTLIEGVKLGLISKAAALCGGKMNLDLTIFSKEIEALQLRILDNGINLTKRGFIL